MSPSEWQAVCDQVTDRMKAFTRPFVTPLVYEPPGAAAIFGSGSYIEWPRSADGADKRLLTCEHVARFQPMQHRPFDAAELELMVGLLCADRDPALDVATTTITDTAWHRQAHLAIPVPLNKFAESHRPVDRELFFFRGLAGENAYLGHDTLHAIVTGYSGQEKPGSGNTQIFEIEWNPAGAAVTSGTEAETARRVRYDDPGGFSGSLVWNTRFVELGSNPQVWTPQDAIVTGLLRRWDPKTGTLLVWRVEHLLAWLRARPTWA